MGRASGGRVGRASGGRVGRASGGRVFEDPCEGLLGVTLDLAHPLAAQRQLDGYVLELARLGAVEAVAADDGGAPLRGLQSGERLLESVVLQCLQGLIGLEQEGR